MSAVKAVAVAASVPAAVRPIATEPLDSGTLSPEGKVDDKLGTPAPLVTSTALLADVKKPVTPAPV
jgi:hypothetical protein